MCPPSQGDTMSSSTYCSPWPNTINLFPVQTRLLRPGESDPGEASAHTGVLETGLWLQDTQAQVLESSSATTPSARTEFVSLSSITSKYRVTIDLMKKYFNNHKEHYT